MDDHKLFLAIRQIVGRGLTQAEVDSINRALYSTVVVAASLGMRVGDAGISLMHEFENCKLTAYPDPGTGGKPWTIGWGNITDENGKPIEPGTTWTQERADARFRQYLGGLEAGLNALIGSKPTTQNQFDALASFAYNVGLDIDDDTKAEGLGDSTLLRCHLAGDYSGAAAQFAKWNRANGKVMRGLTRRRAAEAALYLS